MIENWKNYDNSSEDSPPLQFAENFKQVKKVLVEWAGKKAKEN